MQNFLGLRVRQSVKAIGADTVLLFEAVRAVVIRVHHPTVSARTGQHFTHQFAIPGPVHQRDFCHRRCGRVADDRNEVIDIGQRNGQAFEYMPALARLTQIEHRAPCHHFTAVVEEYLDQILQIAKLGLAVDQRHHIDTEGVLQLGLLVQVVEHHFRHFAALEFNDQAHAGLVRLILNVADALDFLFVYQLGHALLQRLFVDLVGQLIHDDGLALPFVDVFKMAFGPHDDFAAPGAITIFDAVDAVNNAGCREVRCWNNVHQIVDGCLGIAQQMQTGVDHFVEVMRRDIGCHAHGNTARPVDQQIGNAGGQNQRFLFRPIVVGAEVHGLLVQIGQQFVGDFGKSDFCVAHRGSVVAIDRAEIALPIDQHMAHRKILRHANNGVIDRLVAMRVVFADHVAHNTRRLLVCAVPVVVELMHGKQHAPVDGLESVPGVR